MSANIEERRVQRLGTSSLIVTLPKKWVKKVNLKPGDKVTVIIEDNEIKILPPSKVPVEKEKYEIKLNELEGDLYILQLPICLYLLGVKDAILDGQGLDIKTINKIITKIANLSGTQVTCLGNNRMELKVLVDPEENVLELLQSIFRNLALMLRTVRKILEEDGSVDEYIDDARMLQKEIYKKYYSILRLVQYKARLLYEREIFPNVLLSSELGLLSMLLSNIAYNTVEALRYIKFQKVDKNILNTTNTLINTVEELGSLLLDPNHERLLRLKEETLKAEIAILDITKTEYKLNLYMLAKIQDFISLLKEAISLVTCWQTIATLVNKKLL